MKTRTITATILGCAALGGCAFPTQVTRMAMDQNDFVAQTTNNQTLINILRARDREPFHFTSFGTISGNVTLEAGGEVSAAHADRTLSRALDASGKKTGSTKGAATLGLNAQASATVTTGTDFQLAVNATDDFYKGILGPVSQSVIIHYLEDGWPRDLLSYLFIGKIDFYATVRRTDSTACAAAKKPHEATLPECTDSGKDFALVSVANTPDDLTDSERFASVIRCRQLAVAAPSDEDTTVRFADMTEISNVSDASLAKVVDTADAPKDRYKIDLGTKSSSLTMAVDLHAQDDGAGKNGPACDVPRVMLRESMFELDQTAKKAADAKSDSFAALIAALKKPAPPRKTSGQTVHLQNPRVIDDALADWAVETSKPAPDRPAEQERQDSAGLGCDPIRWNSPRSEAVRALVERARKVGTLQPAANYYDPLQSNGRSRSSGAAHGDLGTTGAPFVFKNYFGDLAAKGYEIDLKMALTLRSVEGILYYLGEYLRDAEGPCVKGAGGLPVPIIKVEEGRPSADAEVFAQVRYKKKDYWMGSTGGKVRSQAGRSSQVVSLIQQLLNLHRSSKDLPSVQTVRVTN